MACLLNKPVKPPAQKKVYHVVIPAHMMRPIMHGWYVKVSIVKPRGRNNQFGGDDSDEDMKVVGMLGYNELDDVGV